MTDNESSGRDRKRYLNIALAAAAAIVAGLAIGWAISSSSNAPSATTVPTGSPTTPPVGPTTTTLATTPSTDIPGQVSIVAAEDTYVDEETPDEVNGLNDTIEVEDDFPEVTRGLLRFQVTGIPEGETVRSAVLRLFVVDDGEDSVGVNLVDGPWSQADTNASNAPAIGQPVASIPAPGPEGQYVEVDLGSVVTGPGQFDFYLVPSGSDSIAFASAEDAVNPPVLVVRWAEGAPPAATTTTAPTAETPTLPLLDGDTAVLVGAGDIADCEGAAPATASLLDQTVAEYPQAVVFTAGDNAYGEGTPQEFAECYDPTWGRHKDRTRPSPGNHDYQTDDASGYFDYFGSAAGSPQQGYYSYQLGAWHILSLNSNCSDVGGCDESSPQGQWLRGELAASDALCTLAYWHHPLFSSGEHGPDDGVDGLFRLLYEDGAELVLAGHEHSYERFAPQDPEGASDPERGIRQIVVGTGGRSLRDFGPAAPNSEVRNGESFGVLLLALHENGYQWEFIPTEAGGFTDQGTGACH